MRRGELDDECVRISYGHLPSVAGSAMVTSVVVVAVLRDSFPDRTLAIWLVAVWINALVRLGLWRAFHARPRRGEELPRWWWRLAIAMGVAGSVYGALVLATPGEASLLVVATLTIAIAGHIAGGAQTLVATPGILVISAVTSAVPLLIAMFTSSASGIRMFGAMVVTYLASVVAIGRLNYQSLRASLALRDENLALAERLAQRSEAEAEARAVAEAATRDKTRFLAAASHDLRQPLHALTLFTGALRAEVPSERGAHLLGRVEVSVDALQKLLDGLLDVSRLDAGVVVAAPRTFEAAALGRQVEAMFTEVARERGLRLRVLPTTLWCHADPELTAQVVRNLVANAIRYTTQGGVLVAFRGRGDRVRVQVWDSGIGIAEDQRAAIFGEFHQLGNVERDRANGVGLGLAIVDRLARLLGTRVELASRVGRGSVFGFDLPAAAPGGAAVPTPEVIAPARAHTVLIVDDDVLAREGLAAALESWGYRALAARDLAHGVALAGAHPALDAVVVDYRLPGGRTGAEALDALAAQLGRAPRAVIVTGETEPARIREAHATGHPVLFKPVPVARLREALARLLAS